jgi:hypothetical protein
MNDRRNKNGREKIEQPKAALLPDSEKIEKLETALLPSPGKVEKPNTDHLQKTERIEKLQTVLLPSAGKVERPEADSLQEAKRIERLETTLLPGAGKVEKSEANPQKTERIEKLETALLPSAGKVEKPKADPQKTERLEKLETLPLQSMFRNRNLFADLSDEDMLDEGPTIKLPTLPRLSIPPELRATPMTLSPSMVNMDATWLMDEETWLLPAVTQADLRRRAASAAAAPAGKEEKQTGSGAQGYISLAIEMVKSSGIYAVGALMSPLVSLILTPFLAQHVVLNDYGILSVLYTVVDLVTVVTQLGLGPAFFRAYNSDFDSPRDRPVVLAITVSFLLLTSLPIMLLIWLAGPMLSKALFNDPSFATAVALTGVVIMLENLTLPGVSWLRAEKRPIPYTGLSFLSLLVVLGTNLVLVGVLHMGII